MREVYARRDDLEDIAEGLAANKREGIESRFAAIDAPS
jgi:hypothetical protein